MTTQMPIGDDAGSCGAVAHNGREVVAGDIAVDRRRVRGQADRASQVRAV